MRTQFLNFNFMKTLKLFTIPMVCLALFASCSDDDDPEPVNEEEVITRMIVTLSPDGGGTDIVLQIEDEDGEDGPAAPVITPANAVLSASTTYNGSIVLWNDTETPPENKTEEIEDEDEEHQFFYTVSNGLNIMTEYEDFDDDTNPLGLAFTLTTGAASTGNLTVTLIHEPVKPNTGLGDAGGEVDIAATFNVTIQ